MKKFTFWRNAIISETCVIEAESEEEARMYAEEGAGIAIKQEFIEWATDSFELEDIEELDPLYRMVKDYKSVDKLSN
jgi:hypothetical protein